LALRPSKKSIKRMVDKVHALTVRSRTWQETTTQAGELNRALAGWANYSPEYLKRLAGSSWVSWSLDGHHISFRDRAFVWHHQRCWVAETRG
jgi:hypothetical protein